MLFARARVSACLCAPIHLLTYIYIYTGGIYIYTRRVNLEQSQADLQQAVQVRVHRVYTCSILHSSGHLQLFCCNTRRHEQVACACTSYTYICMSTPCARALVSACVCAPIYLCMCVRVWSRRVCAYLSMHICACDPGV